MIRLLVLTLFWFLPTLSFAPSVSHADRFLFSGYDDSPADPPAGRPNRPDRPAKPVNDEEVEEDYSMLILKSRPRARPSPPPAPPRKPPSRYTDDDDTESRPPCRNCSRNRPDRRDRIVARYSPDEVAGTPYMKTAPVWNTFARNWAYCAPGCQPAKIGIDREPNGSRSCHITRRAIDVSAMVCPGRGTFTGYAGEFAAVVSCMKQRMPTIYRQYYKRAQVGDRLAHFDHAHFSIGCGRGYY